MHPLALLILVTTSVTTVHAHTTAAVTSAERFWNDSFPGILMPDAIADLIHQGIDHSPLIKHSPISRHTEARIFTLLYRCVSGCPDMKGVPPGLFFRRVQVHVGSTMTVFLPPTVLPGILPLEVAKKVPFRNLKDVLSTFNIAPGSADAAIVGDTLNRCQASHPAYEQQACSTSLEDMVKSVMNMLGTEQLLVTASALSSDGLPLQPYRIQAITSLDGERHVGCHNVPYPYAVYQCHMTGMPTKAYAISLRGLHNNQTIVLAAICHLDTSDWNPAYPAFEILDTQPGGAPVCHFLTYGNLLFGNRPIKA